MRPPIAKRLDPVSRVQATDSREEALEEKARLAAHLHAQGVDPERWTEAHPAPQSDQQSYQVTGVKPRDTQFEARGKLYNWSPAVAATLAQARAIADTYVATLKGPGSTPTMPPIGQLVDVAKVPLDHPLDVKDGNRTDKDMSAADERTALYRYYAKLGVDPGKAHLGDPLEMKDQERLKAELAKLPSDSPSDADERPLFYQGFEDGWIYQANAHTRESDAVQKIRAEHAANENIAGKDSVTDKIVSHYEADAANAASDEATDPFESAAQKLPDIIAVIDDLQAGKPLSPDQLRIEQRIADSLSKAGITFDFRNSNPDQLRLLLENAQKSIGGIDPTNQDAAEFNFMLFSLQVSEALAGASFNTARMWQAPTFWDKLKIAPGAFLPTAGLNPTKSTLTALNAATAQDGPIDYAAAVDETKWLLSNDVASPSEIDKSTSDEVRNADEGRRQKTPQPASPRTMEFLGNGLNDARNVEIVIGGIPLFKQSERKTLMDEIFRTEFISIAQENGCLPEPGPDGEPRWHSYGGKEPQHRITDMDQAGHKGSRQPDGWLRWQNPDETWTEVMWNSTTTRADGFTDITREAVALRDIVAKANKQLVAKGRKLPQVAAKPKVIGMGEKTDWSEEGLRDFISKKLRKIFKDNFEDCRFIGENQLEKIDHPDDPDLPSEQSK